MPGLTGPLVVTGSIATDHLMTFPGRFADQFLADHLNRVSLSFLVDELTVRDGGVAANIAYGLARLGEAPVLVGAAGPDFEHGYRSRLERHGVRTEHVHIAGDAQTARFVCTTDRDHCQIASFYPGAMRESARLDLPQIASVVGPLGLVLIGADQPDAMTGHAQACRENAWLFAADPSQQLAVMDAPQILDFITGASYLFTNEYEYELLLAKTGLSARQLAGHVGVVVTTRGADGVRITARGEVITVAAHPVTAIADPTGAGDAFRAGFLYGVARGLPLAQAAGLGCQVAAAALESHGSQEYDIVAATGLLTA